MKKLILFFTTVFVVSCSSNPVREVGKVGLQNTKHKTDLNSMSAMFSSIDGKRLKVGPFTTPNQAIHYVNPGKKVVVSYVTLSGKAFSGVRAADFVFELDFKPDETYTIAPVQKGSCINIRVLDSSGTAVTDLMSMPWFGFDDVERIIAVSSMGKYHQYSERCK
jgi:hypothetical protein